MTSRRLFHCLSCAVLSACCWAGAARAEPAAPACRVEIGSDSSRLPATDLANPQVQEFMRNAEAMARAQFIPLHQLLYPGVALPAELRAKLVYIRQADGIAWASGGEITINMQWFAERPGDVGAIYHELAHVVQAYPANAGDCGWLVEGIADWARYFNYEGRVLADYQGRPVGNYRDAYTNAARFLEWLRRTNNRDVVTALNARLAAGEYRADQDWPALCGAPLDALWTAYAAASSGS